MGDFIVHNVQFYDYKPQSINSMAYDPHTDQLAVGYANGSVCIFNVRQEFYQTQYIAPNVLKSVEALCWLSGGRLFACGVTGYISEVQPRLGTLLHQVPTYAMGAWCMSADKSGSRLAVGTEGGAVCVYKIDEVSGKLEFVETLKRASTRILAISWSHFDNNLIATAGMGYLAILDLRHGQILKEFPCKPQSVVVWDLAFLNADMIASGDSNGQVVLWSIGAGGAIQRFSSHQSQVLTLIANDSSIFASGVDPVVRRYDCLPTGEWIEGPLFRRNTHDVRAMAFTSQGLATGGLEGKVIIFPSGGITAGVHEEKRRIWPLPFRQPRHPHVMSVSNVTRSPNGESLPPICVLNYPDRLEIHRLGDTSRTGLGTPQIRKRHISLTPTLPLSRPPELLQVVVPRRGESLVCSAVSSCGSWLAYSTPSILRILRLRPAKEDRGFEITRCHSLHPLRPCRLLAFLPSSTPCIVAIGSSDGSIYAYDCRDADSSVSLRCHIIPGTEEYTSPAAHLLVTGGSTGDLAAIGCLDGHIFVYSMTQQKRIAQLPLRRERSQEERQILIPTAIALHPAHKKVLAVYTDRQLVEYDFEGAEMGWFPRFNKYAPLGWKMAAHFDWLHYIDAHRILISNSRYLIQLDTNVKVTKSLSCASMEACDMKEVEDGEKKQKRTKSSTELKAKSVVAETEVSSRNEGEKNGCGELCMRLTNNYQFILHVHVINSSELVLLNMKPENYALSLPPALFKKRYGL